NTLIPNTSRRGPNQLATNTPTVAPSTVPMNRSPETDKAVPSDDCEITKVVIGAQCGSGSRQNRAARNDATAATAVRAECTTVGAHVALLWFRTLAEDVMSCLIRHQLGGLTRGVGLACWCNVTRVPLGCSHAVAEFILRHLGSKTFVLRFPADG